MLALGCVGAGAPAWRSAGRQPERPDADGPRALSFADIVERVKPAVVSISVTERPDASRADAEPPVAAAVAAAPLPDLPEDHR